VIRVRYPALADDPGYAIWKRDFRGASGLFGLHLEARAIDTVMNRLRLFRMGVSFGGFESLAIPVDPGPYRTATQWSTDGPYLRLHVGLEDPDDLIADLEQALG
jgi:cysteine-S-conjugate beta-lyase